MRDGPRACICRAGGRHAEIRDGTVLVDMDGRRRVLHGDRHRIDATTAGRGPFRLESANGHLVAISP